MKKFELFIYEDQDENTGSYLGKTIRKVVVAESRQQAEKGVWEQYPWAMGYFCNEVKESA